MSPEGTHRLIGVQKEHHFQVASEQCQGNFQRLSFAKIPGKEQFAMILGGIIGMGAILEHLWLQRSTFMGLLWCSQ
jgi:hypothetical protein